MKFFQALAGRAIVARLPRYLAPCLLALAIWQAAGVFWLLAGPATAGAGLAPPRQLPAQAASRDALLRWFGAEGGGALPAANDYRLLAVIAGERGAALLRGSDGSSVAVRVGDEIRPGSRLVAVEPAAIHIEQGGRRLELKLPAAAAPTPFARDKSPLPPNSDSSP